MLGQRTIVVDLDGTICKNRFPEIGPFIKGAVDAILELRKARWKCIITSCRNNPTLYSFPESTIPIKPERKRRIFDPLNSFLPIVFPAGVIP